MSSTPSVEHLSEQLTMGEVLIVGAGLAGLCCARHLHAAGISFRILEAEEVVGGRVQTDLVEGFRLDRGFQVFLTSYPEAARLLDYRALQLRAFEPGALIRVNGRFRRLTDPWRRPLQGLASLFASVGTFADKLRIARLRSNVLRGSVDDPFAAPEMTTLQDLQNLGFSSEMIERFFRPFLGGIFLEPDLQTSNRMFRFVFRMFATGEASLPALGMGAIPGQLVTGLPAESIRLRTRVVRVGTGAAAGEVELADGEILRAKAVVVATDAPTAARWLGPEMAHEMQSVTCVYFAAEQPPIPEPILVLNGTGQGPVNNLCVPSVVAPSYAPAGAHLVSATVLGNPAANDEDLLRDVRDQLSGWFGSTVRSWRHLRTDRIGRALPRQLPPTLAELRRPVRLARGLYVCGDHRDHASIQGAMVSGRRAAEAVLEDLR